MKKEWKLAVLACAVVALLSACGSGGNQPGETPEPADSEMQEESTPAVGDPQEDAGDSAADEAATDEGASDEVSSEAADEPVSDAAAEPMMLEVQKATGEFVGLADANSAEIIVDGEPLAFRFAEGFDSSVLSELDSGTTLDLEYVEEPVEGDDSLKVLLLTKVEVK